MLGKTILPHGGYMYFALVASFGITLMKKPGVRLLRTISEDIRLFHYVRPHCRLGLYVALGNARLSSLETSSSSSSKR